ncbi:MAG: hypothetical protein M1825_006014 [Sarcosagium campestre]|nr:MAG: hypothetical protein M1825_006014 [Sarcosagium campestre]
MHISNILGLLATTSLLGIASAGCFSGGATWDSVGGKDSANDKLGNACQKLQGEFKKDQEKLECESLTSFKVKYIGKDDGFRTLSLRECEDGLSKEITGCDHGGKTKYRNWEYTADPANEDCAS